MTLMLFFDLYNKYFNYLFSISIFALLFSVLETLTFPMMLVGIAYHCKPLNIFRKIDNITYGLFLYHFPVIQTLVHYGIAEYSLILCFILTFIITSILATFSWFCIEKPLMNKCA
jgi:peptidoglycan/LPS O-acetylase OafA/YrhL